ncbi:MAG: hypothetical protein GF317_07085 [Candidatus Lokiarchaeota archaeon]|nr:hypothetical protein [Candidatus Lokiarchaeota archaeon]MBD3199472.1 hypothetical protein [Candidatus Lokiarchaeota archaeon]
MQKIQRQLQLLALFSIFFIYKVIEAAIYLNQSEIIIWTLFLVIYLVSLTVAYFVLKKKQKMNLKRGNNI